jgi:hypothetical protein
MGVIVRVAVHYEKDLGIRVKDQPSGKRTQVIFGQAKNAALGTRVLSENIVHAPRRPERLDHKVLLIL